MAVNFLTEVRLPLVSCASCAKRQHLAVSCSLLFCYNREKAPEGDLVCQNIDLQPLPNFKVDASNVIGDVSDGQCKAVMLCSWRITGQGHCKQR